MQVDATFYVDSCVDTLCMHQYNPNLTSEIKPQQKVNEIIVDKSQKKDSLPLSLNEVPTKMILIIIKIKLVKWVKAWVYHLFNQSYTVKS